MLTEPRHKKDTELASRFSAFLLPQARESLEVTYRPTTQVITPIPIVTSILGISWLRLLVARVRFCTRTKAEQTSNETHDGRDDQQDYYNPNNQYEHKTRKGTTWF